MKQEPQHAESSNIEKKVAALLEQKEKPVVYVQEEVIDHEDGKVLMKRFGSREPAQKQIGFEEGTDAAGIFFWQIANGDVGKVRKELQKIIAKTVAR